MPNLYRRPTMKTGRGYGKKKKNAQQIGFKLFDAFKNYGYETTQNYEAEHHMEKPELAEKQLSPRQKGV